MLRTKISDYGLIGNFKFLGMQDPNRYYATMDAVIVDSYNEPFGRVTVEAMLHGIPVIAADRGANVELIRDGVNGLLFRAGDSKHLAEFIGKAISTPGLLKRLSEKARIYARDRFDMKIICQELLSFLIEVCNGQIK